MFYHIIGLKKLLNLMNFIMVIINVEQSFNEITIYGDDK